MHVNCKFEGMDYSGFTPSYLKVMHIPVKEEIHVSALPFLPSCHHMLVYYARVIPCM